MERSQHSTVAIATKFTLPLTVLLGCAPPVGAAPDVCVLAPHIEPSEVAPARPPRALVPIERPTLFVREPLAELRIEQGASPLWSWQSPDGSPLEGPLAWPVAPLSPGQTVTLRLRPVGAAAGHYASIRLQAAPRQRLRDSGALLQSLAARPAAWRPSIDDLLIKGDRALATALLFAQEGPNEPSLNALRLLVAQQSCP